MKVKCILLIDDDPVSNYLHSSLLEDLQLAEHLHVAFSGERALEFIKENCKEEKIEIAPPCPQLIFLDINMPVMGGFEFLEAFEQLDMTGREKISVVVLTSSANNNDITRSKKFNVKGYITKPLTEFKVFEVIGKLDQ